MSELTNTPRRKRTAVPSSASERELAICEELDILPEELARYARLGARTVRALRGRASEHPASIVGSLVFDARAFGLLEAEARP